MFAGVFPYYPTGIVFLLFFFFAVNLRFFSTTPSLQAGNISPSANIIFLGIVLFFQGWRIKLQGCGQHKIGIYIDTGRQHKGWTSFVNNRLLFTDWTLLYFLFCFSLIHRITCVLIHQLNCTKVQTFVGVLEALTWKLHETRFLFNSTEIPTSQTCYSFQAVVVVARTGSYYMYFSRG